MGKVLAFPGVTPPEPQPEPVSFEEWSLELVADFLAHVPDLETTDEADFYRAVEALRDRLKVMADGPQ